MKPQLHKKPENEDFFGLLNVYKSNVTYIRVLESHAEDCISLQITDNPGKWENVDSEKYSSFQILRRLELSAVKLSIKFLTPAQLIEAKGPLLGIRISAKECEIYTNADKTLHTIDFPLQYREKVMLGIKNLLNLTPQKKLEIIEKAIHSNIQQIDEKAD